MVKKSWLSVLLVGGLVLVVGVGVILKFVIDGIENNTILTKFPDRGVPRINITLEGTTIDDINSESKEIKYDGNELSLYEGGEMQEFDNVQIKGRGNGAWTREKKPYQIKFSNKVDLFGMGKARKWVLLANAMDATNLRTRAAFYLEEILGMKYRFQGEFVELYVNEEYEGLYYLTHAVEIGKNVVDLRDPMGVLVELDNLYYEGEQYYETSNRDYLTVKDAVNETNTERAMNEFLEKYDEFERVVAERDYNKVAELVDVESFAQYYLLSEFSVNPDAYWTSFYMYKDGNEDKIHAGPGWDFDLAFANKWWGNWMGEDFYSPETTMVRRGEILSEEEYSEMNSEKGQEWYETSQKLSRIMFDMMEMPEFQEEVEKQYQEKMQEKLDGLAISILEWADDIELPMRENHRRWDNEDYWEKTKEMTKWIIERVRFFKKRYGGLQDEDIMLSLD